MTTRDPEVWYVEVQHTTTPATCPACGRPTTTTDRIDVDNFDHDTRCPTCGQPSRKE